MYLPEAAVLKLLNTISSLSASGSRALAQAFRSSRRTKEIVELSDYCACEYLYLESLTSVYVVSCSVALNAPWMWTTENFEELLCNCGFTQLAPLQLMTPTETQDTPTIDAAREAAIAGRTSTPLVLIPPPERLCG